MATDLTTLELISALIIGVAPSLIWLLFWLQTDRDRPEPRKLLFAAFVMGAASVLFATAFQRITTEFVHNNTLRITVWAAIEELLKFFAFFLVAYKSKFNDEPIDASIYLITVALGFAALENIFYAIQPASSFNITASVLTGGLRFFGSTLLHTIASAFIGICIGISTQKMKNLSIICGISIAIFLHATFNFFILKNDTASFLQIYGYLWVAAIISHLILEKLRRLPTLGARPTI